MKDVISKLYQTLAGLKDFQRATVEQIIENFANPVHSHRVLVADEVGLGKTIVAKGVIAQLLIDAIHNKNTRPLRVTYICSNLALANENREKLAVFDHIAQHKYVQEPSFGRLVELAIKPSLATSDKLLEVCSLTPATSFTLTNSDGNVRERRIIYESLITHPQLINKQAELSLLFQSNVLPTTWEREASWFNNGRQIDTVIRADFWQRLTSKSIVSSELSESLSLHKPSCIDVLSGLTQQDIEGATSISTLLYRFRAAIRSEMARSCAQHLHADLFILDEFQRFKELLDGESDTEDSLIAQQIFSSTSSKQCRVLLLSATPFKAMTRIEDDETTAHHEALRHLLGFLTKHDQPRLDHYEQARSSLLKVIISLRDHNTCLNSLEQSARKSTEQALQPYIARTERAQICHDFDSVYLPKVSECADSFSIEDIRGYQALTSLAIALNTERNSNTSYQLLEFYKSSPWPLSFMSGYVFKEHLDAVLSSRTIKKAVKASKAGWLSREKIQNYRLNPVRDAPNAKFKQLVTTVFSDNSEQLLWLAPTMPHYPLQGCFKGNEHFTKSLLFSSWAMVPRALSGLLSYEAERRLRIGKQRPDYFNEKHQPSLASIRFDGQASLAGWSLIYPSFSLAALELPYEIASVNTLLKERVRYFHNELAPLKTKYDSGTRSGNDWYPMASILLDLESQHHSWFEDWWRVESNNATEVGRKIHLDRLKILFDRAQDATLQLGPMPKDLADYLAVLSVAGPGICALRMLASVWPDQITHHASSATGIGAALIQLFNKPESVRVIQKTQSSNSYWRQALNYCVDGDLQGMLDEYGHLLEGSGLTAEQATNRFKDVTGIQTVSVGCQFFEDVKPRRKKVNSTLRCHYAVPLGNQKTDEQGSARIVNIRDAFNSPFKPYVLNSTSIGQEGLDFHWYCSRVIHWNLPANPIDIEQREGRVNRYKSLVVRRRVIEALLSDKESHELPVCEYGTDYWAHLFLQAEVLTAEQGSDLTPYWHMPQGHAQIERVVPMMPMSREVNRLQDALKVLALYRLAFGQPRQEELLSNLLNREFSAEEIEQIKQCLVINLAPLIAQAAKNRQPVTEGAEV